MHEFEILRPKLHGFPSRNSLKRDIQSHEVNRYMLIFQTQYSKALRELVSIKRCRDVNLIKADGLDMRVSTDSAIDTESNVSFCIC